MTPFSNSPFSLIHLLRSFKTFDQSWLTICHLLYDPHDISADRVNVAVDGRLDVAVEGALYLEFLIAHSLSKQETRWFP